MRRVDMYPVLLPPGEGGGRLGAVFFEPTTRFIHTEFGNEPGWKFLALQKRPFDAIGQFVGFNADGMRVLPEGFTAAHLHTAFAGAGFVLGPRVALDISPELFLHLTHDALRNLAYQGNARGVERDDPSL